MNVHSIRFKLTALFTGIITVLIFLLFILNSTMAENFYLSVKRKQMLSGYEEINRQVCAYSDGTITKSQMEDNLEYYTSANGMSILITNSDWTTLYTNNKGEAELLLRLKMSFFNNDKFQDNSPAPSGEQEPEPVMPDSMSSDLSSSSLPDSNGKEEGSSSDKDKPQKKQYGERAKEELIYNMYGSGVGENRDIIVETDAYTLQKVYDGRLLDYYYELWGTLDNGSSMIVRVSIQGIKDNVTIFNSFITFTGIVLIIIGVVAAIAFSSYIAGPIKKLSGIAEKMTNLDFDVKYEGKDKGEIGILGNSMNNMSEKLEETISQLKAANLELKKDIAHKEEIEQMRQGFLSNVSHELKTPIALIQGYAEGLKDGISDDPESMDFYCDVIIDEANKMNIMVKRLLTLNQIEFGEDELVIERFDIVELLQSVVAANDLRASQKGINLSFISEDDKLDVWADEYKTEEVITNYLSNAINHCDFDKEIKVYYKKLDNVIRVYVFNTGKHIPEEDIDNIWVKFYKVDKARTREYGGNGIGLSIVKAIMDAYGKECGVNNVDGGVEFWFDLDAKA